MDKITAVVVTIIFLSLATTMIITFVVEYRSRMSLIAYMENTAASHRVEIDRLLDRIQASSFAELKNAELVMHKVKQVKPKEEDTYEPA